jgi:uncharacterized membrane-anchored protein
MKSLRISILVASFVLLLYSLSTVVFHKERLMAIGKPYKFKVKPIDPADPFRGRYIALNFDANRYKMEASNNFMFGKIIYVTLEEDSAGFAKITNVSMHEPLKGDYVKARVDYVSYDEHELFISYPFRNFYMEESKAPNAEKALSGTRDSLRSVYAKVYVKDGESALDNVYVNGEPLVNFLSRQQ